MKPVKLHITLLNTQLAVKKRIADDSQFHSVFLRGITFGRQATSYGLIPGRNPGEFRYAAQCATIRQFPWSAWVTDAFVVATAVWSGKCKSVSGCSEHVIYRPVESFDAGLFIRTEKMKFHVQ